MKPSPLSSILLTASLTVLGLVGQAAASSLPGWYTDFDQALAVARREGKPLLADIGSDNCHFCRQLESQTLSHPEVQRRLENFVKVQINGDRAPHVVQQFQVTGYPTVVALDTAGREVNRKRGFVRAGEFAGMLDNTLAQVAPPRKTATPDATEEELAWSSRQTAKKETSGQEETAEKVVASADKVKTQSKETAAKSSDSKEATEKASNSSDSSSNQKDTKEFTFYNMGADSVKKTSSEKSQEETEKSTELKPEKKVVAQAAPRATRDAVLATNLPAPSDEVPTRLLNLSATSSTKVNTETKPTATAAEKKTASAKSAPAGASSSMTTIQKLQNAGNRNSGSQKTVASATGNSASAKSSASVEESDEEETESVKESDVTAADVRRWMDDADAHLKAGRKRQARAMYFKVYENDKDNRFGRSDLAYIQYVALSVDADDDALRRQALADIRKFKKLFPNSTRTDHYTVMHAILAADIGETDEAHGLLDHFPKEFPDSRFKDLAYKTWKGLPPVKSSSSASKSSSGSKSSSSSKKTSSASKSSSKKG